MCFTEPGRVTLIDGSMAQVLTGVGLCEASLRLVEAEDRQVAVDDWVLVSLGLVVSIVDQETGQTLLDEMTALREDLGR